MRDTACESVHAWHIFELYLLILWASMDGGEKVDTGVRHTVRTLATKQQRDVVITPNMKKRRVDFTRQPLNAGGITCLLDLKRFSV